MKHFAKCKSLIKKCSGSTCGSSSADAEKWRAGWFEGRSELVVSARRRGFAAAQWREKKKLQSKGHILKQTICSGLITMTSWWWSQSMKDRKWKWNKNFDYDRHLCLLTQSVHETRVIASVRGQNELLTAVVSLTQGLSVPFVTSQILPKVSKYFSHLGGVHAQAGVLT